MLSLMHHEQLKFNKDVSIMRVGNQQSCFLINSDYDQILIIDLVARKAQPVLFPESVDEFLIYSWLIPPDGYVSFLLSSDDSLNFGLALDHRLFVAKKFLLPNDFPLAVTQFCWMNPELNMLDYQGKIWTLKNDIVVPAESAVYYQEPASIYKTLPPQFNIIKPEHRDGGYYLINQELDTIGYLSIPLEKKILVQLENNDYPVDAAQYRDRMFVCFKNGIFQYYQGASQLMLLPKEGQFFGAIDIVYEGDNAYLAVLALMHDLGARPKEFIDIYSFT